MLPKYGKESRLQGHNEIDCWRIHPELVENKGNDKRIVNEEDQEKGKDKYPLMILTGGKVVGNVGEQWKEVLDNQVKKFAPQNSVGKELVVVDDFAKDTVQVFNKFALLIPDDDVDDNNNQLEFIEEEKETS